MSLPSDAAVVDRHTTVSGSLSGQDLNLLGSLEGELRLTGRLHVAAGSRLKARVQAAVVELDGEFEGELRAETLRVTASARAKGAFVVQRISIEEGAFLEGDVQAPAGPTAVVPVSAAGPVSDEGPEPDPESEAETETADDTLTAPTV